MTQETFHELTHLVLDSPMKPPANLFAKGFDDWHARARLAHFLAMPQLGKIDEAIELFRTVAPEDVDEENAEDVEEKVFALQKLAEIACQALPESAAPTHLPEAKWLSEEELHKLRQKKGKALRVNVLGATPLDFAMNGSIDSMRHWLEARGCHVASCWAMGSALDAILASHEADLDLVLSYGGLGAARVLRERAGIPYRIGIPFPHCASARGDAACPPEGPAYIIGETVFAESLSRALEEATGQPFTAIVPMETDDELLLPGTLCLTDEDELSPVLREAALIIADPLYQPICPAGAAFLSLPHIAFSGRLYEEHIPNLIEADCFADFTKKILGKFQQNRV